MAESPAPPHWHPPSRHYAIRLVGLASRTGASRAATPRVTTGGRNRAFTRFKWNWLAEAICRSRIKRPASRTGRPTTMRRPRSRCARRCKISCAPASNLRAAELQLDRRKRRASAARSCSSSSICNANAQAKNAAAPITMVSVNDTSFGRNFCVAQSARAK